MNIHGIIALDGAIIDLVEIHGLSADGAGVVRRLVVAQRLGQIVVNSRHDMEQGVRATVLVVIYTDIVATAFATIDAKAFRGLMFADDILVEPLLCAPLVGIRGTLSALEHNVITI